MRIADGLAASPAVAAVREALGPADGVWIVGGAVREAALGRPVLDLDIAVAGDERTVAKQLSRALKGPAFQLSEEFGTWRTLDRDRSWGVDVTGLRGGRIEEDLALRDFTVNAMAVPLADGDPVDPHGGLADLEAGTLRAVSGSVFDDDPLRLLRAARFAVELGFDLESGTVALARTAAARAAEPAGERQFAELRRMLGGADPVGALELLDELGITAAVLPEVEALKGVEQNPNHHLDVHGHTLEVLRQLVAAEGDLASYAGDRSGELDRFLDEPLADEMTRRTANRFGALLHDVGKPVTRGAMGEYVTFIGHDREGAGIVAGACERLRTSRRFRAHVEGLTLHHLRLGFLIHERPLSRRRVHEYLRVTEPVTIDVTLLSVADRMSARGSGPVASEEMVEAHLELAREMLGAALDWHRAGPPRPPIGGDELAGALGIETGPEVGRLMAEIEAAQYAGEVSGRDDAIEVARRALAGGE